MLYTVVMIKPNMILIQFLIKSKNDLIWNLVLKGVNQRSQSKWSLTTILNYISLVLILWENIVTLDIFLRRGSILEKEIDSYTQVIYKSNLQIKLNNERQKFSGIPENNHLIIYMVNLCLFFGKTCLLVMDGWEDSTSSRFSKHREITI